MPPAVLSPRRRVRTDHAPRRGTNAAATALLALLLCASASAARAGETFQCGDAPAGIDFKVTIDTEKRLGSFQGMGRGGLLSPDAGGVWINPETRFAFTPHTEPQFMQLGSMQFLCAPETPGFAGAETAGGQLGTGLAQSDDTLLAVGVAPGNAALASSPAETPSQKPVADEEPLDNLPGRSLGGHLRQGPGTEFPSLGKLAENRPVTLLARSSMSLDGYQWFRVALSDGRYGYQWGGILCAVGAELPGLYQTCGLAP
ncbi:SH3 domain-containing protein [Pseudohoeflea coraliihabitans]|uniref:SH3 domain-containing protein n=1 Tax=Pseudohoeflea coraliihabitans TaxID=2860393 RepID=A0ABS6WRY4_9HYPH|nr:SH3 domain-containing protein [Pseudohoeflea sp. DP4N28-3]MBW3098722.1 SH3 domain-containing protein [Pseudohoeflea sp. DP4N28-3]